MQMMNRATIAVCPSLRAPKQVKAFRTRIGEYMAASLPIVSSDLPQDMELIESNSCGILAQPETPQSFADAIIKLVRDREFACRLGKNGQDAFKEKHSWESELPKLLAFYDQILGT
jgi:glycosyltransferase involved in cell wall biosynthesis